MICSSKIWEYLNNQWIKAEIRRKTNKQTKKYLETNEIGNVTYQNSWDVAKAVLRGMFVVINVYLKKQGKSQMNNLTSPQGARKIKKSVSVSIGVPHLIALDFAALCRYCIFYKLMACGHPALSDAG